MYFNLLYSIYSLLGFTMTAFSFPQKDNCEDIFEQLLTKYVKSFGTSVTVNGFVFYSESETTEASEEWIIAFSELPQAEQHAFIVKHPLFKTMITDQKIGENLVNFSSENPQDLLKHLPDFHFDWVAPAVKGFFNEMVSHTDFTVHKKPGQTLLGPSTIQLTLSTSEPSKERATFFALFDDPTFQRWAKQTDFFTHFAQDARFGVSPLMILRIPELRTYFPERASLAILAGMELEHWCDNTSSLIVFKGMDRNDWATFGSRKTFPSDVDKTTVEQKIQLLVATLDTLSYRIVHNVSHKGGSYSNGIIWVGQRLWADTSMELYNKVVLTMNEEHFQQFIQECPRELLEKTGWNHQPKIMQSLLQTSLEEISDKQSQPKRKM